jgi:hypothetical protein
VTCNITTTLALSSAPPASDLLSMQRQNDKSRPEMHGARLSQSVGLRPPLTAIRGRCGATG